MRVRYHLDENIDHAVAEGLRRRDIDVTTPSDAQLIGASDQKHIDFARSQGRVIFTHDVDFLRLAHQGIPHAGIAYCHPRRFSIGEMILALVALWRHRTAEHMLNRVEYL